MGAGLASSIVIADTLNETMKSRRAQKTTEHQTSNEVKFCPECGAKNKKTSKFCAECGSKFAGKVTCKNCGTELPKTAKFCPECGQKK